MKKLTFKQAFIEVMRLPSRNRKTALNSLFELLNAVSANITYKEVEQRFNDMLDGMEIAKDYKLVEEELLFQMFLKT